MVEEATHNILKILTPEQRAELEARGKRVPYEAGERIFREGEPSHYVLLIQKGHVKVTRQNVHENEVILAIRGPDEVMGDEGVLMDEPRSATVTTISEVVGLNIAAKDLVSFVNEHNLWPEMYRAAVRRRRQSEQLLLRAPLNVKGRLARWLLDLAAEVGENTEDGWVIETTLSQQQFAGRIGATRDAVAIALRQLREQGIVSTGRQRIVLHDLERLRTTASR
ncbi:Crp/Fnr family transcriptional regulator [Kibdelosporangium persicum]|uniref:cAMP-binding domain of CRP n=1 Tax=Kibdelosporangium persicum TaxID=2698649 RepID=A0ABX2EWS2_9PSEU|nr:Crp/Fnr family transcriptional regulator [Kibdelosporangium persicum]NRN63442.1 cAMP-binding domain of CRP [Kibdelosporangium persicum]